MSVQNNSPAGHAPDAPNAPDAPDAISAPARRSGSVATIFFCLALLAAAQEAPGDPVGAGPGHDGAPDVDGALLLAAAAELGLSESAARATLHRLRGDGMVISQRAGRRARYRAAPAVTRAQRRWTEHFRHGPPAWDGAFAGLLHDFPERQRSRRDAFRRAAQLAGYALLRPGLLISPDDRWSQLEERFAPDERAGRVLRAGLTFAPSDAPALAGRLWRLDELGRDYRRIVEHTRRSLAARPDHEEAGTPALRELYALSHPIYDAIARDPALPAALLPAGWPARELGGALDAVNRRLGPPAVAHLADLRRGLERGR